MPIISDRARVVELEAELAATRAELAALRDPLRHVWRGGFVPPSDTELMALMKTVLTAAPILAIKSDDPYDIKKAEKLFINSLIALSHAPRHPKGEISHFDKQTWIDRSQDLLLAMHLYPDNISLAAFTAAALAHGDIAHTFSLARYPHDLAFGLGNHTGLWPTGAGWKGLLSTRQILPAKPFYVATGMPPANMPRPRIYGGGGGVGEVF